MDIRGNELLALLGSGVRPEGSGASRPTGALDGKSFADLLSDVRSGKLSSGRPVEIGAHVDVELSEAQLERLGVVADAAEAAGASRVAAMIDGQVVTLDVLTRTIEGVQEGAVGQVMTGIDAFVVVPEEVGGSVEKLFGGALGLGGSIGGESGWGARVGGGLETIRNRSVAELLGGLFGGDEVE